MAIEHKIEVDEEVGDFGEAMFRAFCTEQCGWAGEHWQHEGDFGDRGDPQAVIGARIASEEDGELHLAEVTA